MAIKYTRLGGLIYATMGLYLLAFLVSVLARAMKSPRTTSEPPGDRGVDPPPDVPPGSSTVGRAGRINPVAVFAHVLYAAGFVLAVVTYIDRAIEVNNVPLQNLFEAFLAMMVLIWPISMICRRFFAVRGEMWDMLIGAGLCVMPGFIRDADISPARPALQTALFVPHVLAYMIATVLMIKATIQAIGVLVYGDTSPGANLASRETATYRMVCISFPPLTAGLILGCIWAKYAWSDFWSWDPKEQWSLSTWMTFVAYFHMRYMFGRKHPKLNAAVAITCMVVILLTLFWANLSAAFKGIHSYA